MILNCPPVKRLQGTIHLPASKSYSIRAFIIAALGGVSQILHASDSEDAAVALKTAGALGKSKARSKIFSVGESGTTLRFLLPLLALHAHKAKVVGRGTLKGRPTMASSTAERALASSPRWRDRRARARRYCALNRIRTRPTYCGAAGSPSSRPRSGIDRGRRD